jgi:TonB family protein
MRAAPGSGPPAQTGRPARDIYLLIVAEPWLRIFLRNLGDLFRTPEASPHITSAPAAFWPDVFVERRLPWHSFAESGACHVFALAVILAGSSFFASRPHVAPHPTFTREDVIYFTASEYLPPLDTRTATPSRAAEADPEYSAQPIISVPPEADNRSQTIVTPPSIRLQHDVALPNMVALVEKLQDDPRMPIGPAPAVPASEISRLAPRMDRSIITPPPDVRMDRSNTQTSGPQPAVIAPPPSVEATSMRRVGDLDVGHSAVIAPAPLLSLDEQRALRGVGFSANPQPSQIIAPPPSMAASGGSGSSRNLIALSLHPAVSAPPAPPEGNRRGNFAATPEGHRGGSGAPGAAGNGKEDGSGSGQKGNSDLPSGLYVGKTSNPTSAVAGDPAPKASSANSVNPNLIANARPPRISGRSLEPEAESKLAAEERAVFGSRKFYSLSLNMPNLNSAGGSWIIRFAALKPEADSGPPSARAAAAGDPSGGGSSSDLSAPSATRKVDPAYPLELMRQNVAGTVILYAVIHADGTVGSVRVLRSADERLDHFASEAVSKWQFQPATKDGAPVDVEATFWIPFRPAKANSNF